MCTIHKIALYCSLISTTLILATACTVPIPSSLHTSAIPPWQSLIFSCAGSAQAWEVRSSPGKGMGVFATRTLEPGDIILEEAPVIRISPPQFRDGVAYPLNDVDQLLRGAYESLSATKQADVMGLYAHTTSSEEETNRVLPIFRSNAYIIGTNNTDLGLFTKGSRINHSCRPNSSQFWSDRLGKRVVYAIGRIEEGEEVFTTYIPLLHHHEYRQKRLVQYGFKCTCEACAQEQAAQEASDKRRQDIRKAFDDFEPQLSLSVPKSSEGRKRAEKNANASVQLAGLVEEEGLADFYAQAYRIAAISYARIEKWESATLWAHKSYQLRMMAGETSPAALEMQGLTSRFISSWNEDLYNQSMKQS